ncbi:glycine betaine/L-proline ABC transporter ATP-binding protein ProV [Rhodospirillum rubrum]|uniref:Quaternary amine transport ATP-binding protein n=1 Tax=Rhodospirillum rubrum (strain ATCC 11170 / ATH 1.1.1 / DSM 467 / LMG 4362 / NCIMB 8255 / S1) TaxID=269796 RepID=Q2RRH0_RHORT|nr:glycine betaine/L-proline ABC transporter ATP-binding protein ProV [Rhodospirillum rubrum]ABC23275.1 Glycine betaine/L-proline transport ATP-binding subunit [Rhodospirillum rubrum ATCC 11170]AEO49007.1 glycine betaine/L-proline transport ATP-binding subunit [Rhodospirillum rubrum F11]MBK5954945.1 glycine betaine/L-proline ABC transporter ATP-binding protein [Rhodospirillum rubrum]QXG79250.1 glycine betaine/L-proline ABC transporter ATP-binding protein ProV [Rhodospirillum rubrum]HAQ01444.1 
MPNKIAVKGLYKVFGDTPETAIALSRSGADRSAIQRKTGMTMGVCDASFTIQEGEIFVIMGLSGSGKSTLVRLLNRLIEPSAGSIVIDGIDIAGLAEADLNAFRHRHLSMVFQSFALMPHLTVLGNAAFGLELSGVKRPEREARARAALTQVGLADWANQFPTALSGGMRQRVGLARALATDPDVLLMDEAFSALDPLNRAEMQDQLLSLQDEQRRTIIFITHDLDEAMRIGDRIAIMEAGRIVQIGTPDEILNNPADDYVRSFFRGVNLGAVLSAGSIARKRQVTMIDREGGLRVALQRLAEADRDYAYVIDKAQRYHGVVSVASLEALRHKPGAALHDAFLGDVSPVPAATILSEIITQVAQAPCGLPVIDDAGRYLGVISRALLLETLDRETLTNG